jgi:hypothetical protein
MVDWEEVRTIEDDGNAEDYGSVYDLYEDDEPPP